MTVLGDLNVFSLIFVQEKFFPPDLLGKVSLFFKSFWLYLTEVCLVDCRAQKVIVRLWTESLKLARAEILSRIEYRAWLLFEPGWLLAALIQASFLRLYSQKFGAIEACRRNRVSLAPFRHSDILVALRILWVIGHFTNHLKLLSGV